MLKTGLYPPLTATIGSDWRQTLARFINRIGAFLSRRSRRGPEEEIGYFISRNGGILTDDLERRISRHMFR